MGGASEEESVCALRAGRVRSWIIVRVARDPTSARSDTSRIRTCGTHAATPKIDRQAVRQLRPVLISQARLRIAVK
jgi:hypothetical protein